MITLLFVKESMRLGILLIFLNIPGINPEYYMESEFYVKNSLYWESPKCSIKPEYCLGLIYFS